MALNQIAALLAGGNQKPLLMKPVETKNLELAQLLASQQPARTTAEAVLNGINSIGTAFSLRNSAKDEEAKALETQNAIAQALRGATGWTNPDTGQKAIQGGGQDALIANLLASQDPQAQTMGMQAYLSNMDAAKPETEIGRLLAERDRLDPNSPNREIYDTAIKGKTEPKPKTVTAYNKQTDSLEMVDDSVVRENPEIYAPKDQMKAVKEQKVFDEFKGEASRLIGDLLTDKESVKAVVGSVDSKTPTFMSGSVDAENKIKQLRSMLASTNLDKMKGAMSDKDIEFLYKIAAGGLEQSMSDDAFVKELERIHAKLTGGQAPSENGWKNDARAAGGYKTPAIGSKVKFLGFE